MINGKNRLVRTAVAFVLTLIPSFFKDLTTIFNETNPDFVFHLAAQTSVPKSMEDPLFSHKINTLGTVNVLAASRVSKVKKVIFSSNHKSEKGFPFNLYMINMAGSGLKQITYDGVFDAFPMFSYDGKFMPAHRFAFLLHKGDIAENMVVHQTCENSGCVNPEHLEICFKDADLLISFISHSKSG